MTDEEFDRARMEDYQPDCMWYVDEDADGGYARSDKPNGFCLIQDLFTCCVGRCKDFEEDKWNEEIKKLKWENKQLLEDNENYQKENEELQKKLSYAGYRIAELKQKCDELNEFDKSQSAKLLKRNAQLEELIEKMKPYCKEFCKNYLATGFMANDCYNGVCKTCAKWEFRSF